MTVENLKDARDIIRPHFKPTVLKNGDVVYRANDGSVVVDQAYAVTVKEATDAATMLALSLADERFRGKASIVEGSDEFKRQVTRFAALEGLSIRFADSKLESERQRYTRTKELSRLETHEDVQQTKGQTVDLGRTQFGR